MTTVSDPDLGYQINDADNHFNEPPDCFERYIDPKHAELAIRSVTGPDGNPMQLFAGKPSKFHSKPGHLLRRGAAKTARRHHRTIGTGRGRVPQSRRRTRTSTSSPACCSTGSTR